MPRLFISILISLSHQISLVIEFRQLNKLNSYGFEVYVVKPVDNVLGSIVCLKRRLYILYIDRVYIEVWSEVLV